jgi:predicted ATP-dependent protease
MMRSYFMSKLPIRGILLDASGIIPVRRITEVLELALTCFEARFARFASVA